MSSSELRQCEARVGLGAKRADLQHRDQGGRNVRLRRSHTTPPYLGLGGGVDNGYVAPTVLECVKSAPKGIDLLLTAQLIGLQLLKLVAQFLQRSGIRALRTCFGQWNQAQESGGRDCSI
jgi:hypothetical protein